MWIATCQPEVSEKCLRQCRSHQKSEMALTNQTNQSKVGKLGERSDLGVQNLVRKPLFEQVDTMFTTQKGFLNQIPDSFPENSWTSTSWYA